MKVWVISRIGRCGFDEYDGAVIVAETEEDVRRIAVETLGDESSHTWSDDRMSTCTVVDPSDGEGLVLSSFNAG